MMKKLIILSFVALMFIIANNGYAFGPHDENCIECHSVHQAKAPKLAAVAATGEKYLTGEPVKGVDAFCLGCHNKNVGIMPVEMHKTHPVGVTPKKAKVPPTNLSAEGIFTCTSCHDPHPSNPNYKYLILDTKGGKDLGKFCAYCHPAQAPAVRAEAAPASAPATAPKKK
ncbi:MAG: cytochrome C [Proteobacteria bacterium]|nr:cytochrome C [Pseudomonadota bacterium]